MSTRRLLALSSVLSVGLSVGLGALGGCGLDTAVDPLAENGCTVTSDCVSGDVCVTNNLLGRGVCVATDAELGAVLLEVKPTNGGESSFVFPAAVEVDGASPSGLVKNVELTLPESYPVTGLVIGPPAQVMDCQGTDGSIPVSVTLHRVFDAGPFRFDASTLSTIVFTSATASTAAFSLDVPAGKYVAHVVPTSLEGCPAPPPPRLVPVEVLEEEGALLDLDASTWSTLKGTLTVPADVDVEGWTLELVDPTYGHVISDAFTLTTPPEGEPTVDIGGESGIRYNRVDGAILRLRNATGELVVHWSVSALDLNSDGVVDVDLLDLVAVPEDVEATLIDASEQVIPNAQVTLQSRSLTGNANQNASFRVSTTSDTLGVVRVSLVPGTYAVTVVPTTEGVAAFSEDWEISSGMGGSGKGFKLPLQTRVLGTVADHSGVELVSAPLRFGPRPRSIDYFQQAFNVDGQVTRYTSATTTELGTFEALVDPGTVDVAVTMLADTGYPWLVLPSRVVPDSSDLPTFDLGALEMPSPAVVQGLVTSSAAEGSAPLSLALVYAYVKAGDDPNAPLIQVGATKTDVKGRFFLPLPPTITAP